MSEKTVKFERLRRRCIDHYRALASIQMAHSYACTQLEQWNGLAPAIASALHVSSVIAYCRPFTAANTKTGKKWLYPDRDLKRTDGFDKVLHDHLLALRNTIVAHSDYNLLSSTMFLHAAGDNNELPVDVGIIVKRLLGINSISLLERHVKHFAVCQRKIAKMFDAEFNSVCRVIRDDPSLFAATMQVEKVEHGPEKVLEILATPKGLAGDVAEPDFGAEFDGYQYEKLIHRRALVKTGAYSAIKDGSESDLYFEIRGPTIDGVRPIEVDLSSFVPSTAIAATLTISISPREGAVLVSSPRTKTPVRFNGSIDKKDVPVLGPRIYLELIEGTTEYEVSVDGYTDDI